MYDIDQYSNAPRGTKISCVCDNCKINFTLSRSRLYDVIKSNQRVMFCCKQCSDKYHTIKDHIINCPKCQTPFNPRTNYGFKKFCSRKCSNSHVRSKESKKKMSEYAKNNPRGCVVPNPQSPNNRNFPEAARKAAKAKWDKLRLELHCKECDKHFEVPYSQRKRKYCSVECSRKNSYHPNSTRVKNCVYKGYKMNSGAELLFAQKCDELGIVWHKNTEEYFEFIKSDGKMSRYYPDFYLKKYDIWVEVKGKRYIRPDDDLRRASVGKPVFLLISNQFKKYFEDFLNFINFIPH